MEQLRKRDTKSIGDRSEAIAIAVLVQVGYNVSVPFGENHRYDIVIDDGSTLSRVQVKTGRLRKGAILFNAYSSHFHRGGSLRPYAGEVEYFAVYCPDVQSVYLVPAEESGISGSLRVEQTKNGQWKKIRWADRYLVGVAPRAQVGMEAALGVPCPGL